MAFVTFRGATLLLALGLGACTTAASRPGVGARLSHAAARKGATLFGLACLAGFVAMHARGPALGHRTSAAHIAEVLGKTVEGERCVVHLPRELSPSETVRTLEDCEFRVARAEEVLGVTRRPKLIAYFYRDEHEKRALMGAGRIYIAKPWRGEVHLQRSTWPHPILAHEVVHVIAAETARGPFRVAGTLGGWLPDPALIEGTAVAVAWDLRDGMTPHQWARAMLELDRLPPARDLMGLSFLLSPARQAYTATGSLLAFVRETQGAEVLRRAYRTGDLAGATGLSVEELERRWHAHLRRVSLPDDAMDRARARFARPSIWSAICPHQVAQLREALGADLAAGDYRAVRRTCAELTRIDPGDLGARATLVGALAEVGEVAAAEAELEALVGSAGAPPPFVARAEERMADALWRAGEAERAGAIYRALVDEPMDEDSARNIELKALAIEGGEPSRALLFELMVGREPPSASVAEVMHLAARLDAAREDGLGAYIASRQLARHGRYDLAQRELTRAVERGLPSARLRREAARMSGEALYATGDLAGAARRYRAIEASEDFSVADHDQARDWLARITWRRAR